jgi:hypothetical protein
MNIEFEKHLIDIIKSKLIKNGYVILPNWGAFFLEPTSAKFDKRNKKLLPPGYNIHFNSNIHQNDGELLIELTKRTTLNYFEVLNILNDYYNLWNENITKHNFYLLDGLGKFCKEKNNIIFIPTSKIEFTNFYGLRTLNLDLDISDNSIIFSYPEKKERAIKSWLKAAIIIPIAIAFSLIPSKINYYNNQENKAGLFRKQFSINSNKIFYTEDVNVEDIEKTIDSLTNLKNALKPNFKEKTTFKEETKKQNNENIQNNNQINAHTKKYYIIIASFTKMRQVEEYNKFLKSKNINSILLNCDGKLRVALSSHETREEANAELNKFIKQYPELSGWILFW